MIQRYAAFARIALASFCILAGLASPAAASCSSPFDPKACVTSVSPAVGPANAAVTITGFGFKSVTNILQSFDVTVQSVRLAGVPVDNITVVDNNKIIVLAGTPLPGPLPSGSVEVITSVSSNTNSPVNCTANPSDCTNLTAELASSITFTYDTQLTLTAVASLVSNLGGSYLQANNPSGGTGPYIFSKISGNLPPGTLLNTNTGVVLGTLIAPSGPFNYTIKVVDANGQSATATVVGSTAPPTISSVSPNQGYETGGQAVTVSGTGFGGAIAVKIGGTSVSFTILSQGSQISLLTPPHAPGPVDIYVETLSGSATATGAYTYIVTPKIASVSPTTGPTAGSQTIEITGSDFNPAAFKTFVNVGGVSATDEVVIDATTITAKTPESHVLGPQNIEVVQCDKFNSCTTTRIYNAYTYQDAPTVTSILPAFGPVDGGQNVAISGTNFSSATSVTIGGVAATNIVVVGPTSITATTPANAIGTADVVVSTPSGAGTGVDFYTYAATPTVTAISPSNGPTIGGQQVTITGTNFNSATAVTIGGVAATSVIVINSTKITAVTPAHGAEIVDVAVTTPTGTGTGAALYSYGNVPIVNSITPPTGPIGGGTAVTITGQNFSGATAVIIGGQAATGVLVAGPTSITATTPEHAAGVVDVVVITPIGTGTGTRLFTYVSPLALSAAAPLAIFSTPSSTLKVGEVYSQANVATGGTPPYSFSITGGSVPAGTSLTPSTGLVFGTPTTSGPFSYTVTVTDNSVPPLTASQTVAGTIAVIETTTELSTNLNPSLLGEPVTFTATITPTAATGTVTFTDGPTVICNAVPLANGFATCTVPFMTAGIHPIRAAYSGSAAFGPSTSLVLAQTINDQRIKTVQAIGQFLNRRNDLVLSNEPDMNRQIDRLIEAESNTSDSSAAGGFVQTDSSGRTSTAAFVTSRYGDGPDASDLSRMRFGIGKSMNSSGIHQGLSPNEGIETDNSFFGAADTPSHLLPLRLTGDSLAGTRISFSTSLRDMVRYAAAEEARKISSVEQAQFGSEQGFLEHRHFNPFDIWVEGKYVNFRDSHSSKDTPSRSDGQFGLISIGADYVLAPWLLVGAMAQFDLMSEHSAKEATEVNGRGWMAGPYATLRLTDEIFFQARGAWGGSDNEVSPFLTYKDHFQTERWLASAKLTGRWTAGPWTFRPSASVAYMEDVAESYADHFGIVIPEVKSRLGQVKAGPEIGYRYRIGSDLIIEPHVAMEGIWNFAGEAVANGFGFTANEISEPDGVRGRVEIGQRATNSSGIAVNLSASYDGIGAKGYEAITAKGQVHVPLQ